MTEVPAIKYVIGIITEIKLITIKKFMVQQRRVFLNCFLKEGDDSEFLVINAITIATIRVMVKFVCTRLVRSIV